MTTGFKVGVFLQCLFSLCCIGGLVWAIALGSGVFIATMVVMLAISCVGHYRDIKAYQILKKG